MTVSRRFDASLSLSLLLLLLSLAHTCLSQKDGSPDADTRGFTGTETSDGVWLGSEGRKALSSRLTTVFLPIVYIVVFVVGLPANGLAVWVFLFRSRKKHPSSIYMANLALADLLFIVWIPLKISYHFNGNDWTYGEPLCKVLVAFFYANMYCSILFIACLSVHRYWAVVYPLGGQQANTRAAVCVSAAVWLTVWLLTTPLYLYDQQVRVSNLGILTCHDVTKPSQKKTPAGYFLAMGVVGFAAPAAVCVVSYVLTLRALRNSMADPAVAKKRRKAVVLIATVLVMFLVCFAPSNAMLMAHYVLLLQEAENNMYGFYVATLCLASLNSCIDPFVYYFISEDFREQVRNTFLCRSQRTVERMRVSFSALKYSKKSSAYTSTSGNTQSTDC